MKKILFLLTISVFTSTVSCKQASKDNVEYYCPMHPEVVQNEPGTCPKCNMTLEEREVKK